MQTFRQYYLFEPVTAALVLSAALVFCAAYVAARRRSGIRFPGSTAFASAWFVGTLLMALYWYADVKTPAQASSLTVLAVVAFGLVFPLVLSILPFRVLAHRHAALATVLTGVMAVLLSPLCTLVWIYAGCASGLGCL